MGVESRLRETALDAASDILARRGEALAFSWVHHAAFARLARKGLLADALAAKLKMPVGRFVHDAVIAGLHEGYAQDFDHYESKERFLWLRRSNALDAPLIDRVDDAVREILSRGAPVSREELEDALYCQFPGDLTPEAGLVELCAAAYADRFARDGAWRWRVEDADAEKSRALDVLTRLGERLEYVVERPDRFEKPDRFALFDLVWKSNGEIAHGFIWRDRALFADAIAIHIAPACGYVVIPEARAALLREKTRHLPHLADAFHEAGWHFVRVPFAEKLLNAEKIERSDVALMAGLMPPAAEDKTQLELF